MSFDDLPKIIKEEIWSYLDERESYNLRKISTSWKKEIDNPKTPFMKQRYERGKNFTKICLNRREKFYGNAELTKEILIDSYVNIGLKCCYGNVGEIT